MSNISELYNRRYLEGYRKTLKGYEKARWEALYHFICSFIETDKTKTILDYGCGRGSHIELWKSLFPQSELFFCDISPVALQILVNEHPEYSSNNKLIDNNIAQFPDNYFDLIISVEVMEHVEDYKSYLSDIHRLLMPGGSFIWTTPCGNYYSIEHIYSSLTGQIEQTKEGYRRWKWEDPTHIRRFKSKEVKSELERHGFHKVLFRYRAHFFSFICSRYMNRYLRQFGEKLMLLDYNLFRIFPNAASMIGFAKKRS